jgi:hypothetical protein
VIHSLERLVVKAPPTPQIAPEEAQEGEEVTMKVPNNDFAAYTELIQKMKIEPEDAPDVLGKFKVVLDGATMEIISKKPLSIREAIIVSNLKQYEVFIEDHVVFNKHFTDVDFVEVALNEGAKIVYYTKKTKILRKDDDMVLRLDLLGNAGVLGEVYRVQMYAKVSKISTSVLLEMPKVTPAEVVWTTVDELRGFAVVKDGALFAKKWNTLTPPQERHVALLEGLIELSKIIPMKFNVAQGDTRGWDVWVTAEGMAVTIEVKKGVPINSIEDYYHALLQGAEVKPE